MWFNNCSVFKVLSSIPIWISFQDNFFRIGKLSLSAHPPILPLLDYIQRIHVDKFLLKICKMSTTHFHETWIYVNDDLYIKYYATVWTEILAIYYLRYTSLVKHISFLLLFLKYYKVTLNCRLPSLFLHFSWFDSYIPFLQLNLQM